MLALRGNTSAAELFYLRHLRTCAATAYGSNKTGHAGHGNVLGTSWLSFLGLEAAWNALLQSMLVLCLFVQLVSRCVLWICDYILRCAKVAVAYLWRAVVALLQSMLRLKFFPLELAACFHIIDANERATVFFTLQGGGPELARLLLSVLCLMLAMMSWHVPRFIGCHMLLCRTLSALCMQCFCADYTCIAMAFLFPTFGKRLAGQKTESSSKRTAAISPATELSPGTPTDTEATMQDPGNAARLRSSGSAAEPDAATEHIAVEAEASMSMDAIVTESTAHPTDDARDVIKAAQTILKGDQNDIRNLCKPWGVQLRLQKRYRPMETIKQELKMSLAKRAMELKSATDASAGGAATEHAESEFHLMTHSQRHSAVYRP